MLASPGEGDILSSPVTVSTKALKSSKGLKLFKEKIKKSLLKVPEKDDVKIEEDANAEDAEISVVKCLPKGSKVKFTFVPADTTETEKPTAKKYSCSLCKKIFLTRAGFDTHVMKDHKNARPVISPSGSPAPAVKKLICSYCKQMFSNRPDFMQHMADDHPDVSSSGNSSALSGNSSSKITKSPSMHTGKRKSVATIKHPCTSCNRKFLDLTDLEEHQKAEHSFPCPTCSVISTSKSKLVEHKKAEHTLTCSSCSKKFTGVAELEHHKKSEHNFQCPNCTVISSSKSALAEHKRNEHTFKCMKCPVTFEVKKCLEEHLIVEHYFKCEDCDIVFESRKSIQDHNISEHTFRCGECQEVFYTEERQVAHVKEEHQSCEVCEDEFSWADADHRCYYTKKGISPPSERVIEQNLYQGYFFSSRD